MSTWDWVDEQDKKNNEDRSKDYFNIKEGAQQFVLLSHFARLAQVFDPATKKYRIAEEGDTNVSIKGVCWVWQNGVIKQAKMPYTVVKAIRSLSDDPDWEFAIPFPHAITLIAKKAGTKEVEYQVTPSPKKTDIPDSVINELRKKPSPDDIVERMKNRDAKIEMPPIHGESTDESLEGLDPQDIPWD